MLEPGHILHGYRIESELGRGGMGVVYRAEQMSLDRPVALKVLSARHLIDPVFRERFRREGRIAAQLDHPNIVPVFEAGEADGYLYIAMRLIDGPDFADLIAEQGPLRWQRVLEILTPIASALDAAHAAGLVHRDVKPQNILISSSGQPYLADFGLMKGARQPGVTRAGEWLGSPDYAAPEHMTSQPYTHAGDVYSLTAVLFHALTGHPPFDRGDDLAVLHAHAHAPRPKLRDLNPRVPTRLDRAIARGMAKKAANRPASASELMRQVAQVLRESNVDAVLVPDPVDALRRHRKVRAPARGRRGRRRPPTDQVEMARSGTATYTLDVEPAHPPTSLVESASVARNEIQETTPGAPSVAHPRAGRNSVVARRWLAVLAGILASGGVIAAAVALSGGQDAAAREVTRPSLSLTLDRGWHVSPGPAPQGLSLSDRVTATRGDTASLSAGHLENPHSGSNPLPAPHRATWQESTATAGAHRNTGGLAIR